MSVMKIVVVPDDNGVGVYLNNESIGSFTNCYFAASAYAEQVAEVRRLESVIQKHTAFLNSRTPSEVEAIGTATFRTMANDLLSEIGKA